MHAAKNLFLVRSSGANRKQCRSGIAHRIAAGGKYALQLLKLRHQRIGQFAYLSGGVVGLVSCIGQSTVGLLIQ